MRELMRCWSVLIFSVLAPLVAAAHTMNTTQLLASFERPGSVDVKIEIDLTLILGSSQRYYEMAMAPPAQQRAAAERIAPDVAKALQLYIAAQPLQLTLRDFTMARATKAEFLDSSISKHSTFDFVATLPAAPGPLKLQVPLGAPIDFPVAYTVQIPAADVSITRWLEPGMHEGEPVEWASKLAQPESGTDSKPGSKPAAEPDALPWDRQLALYLRLGFKHIVPEGTDHILFVLGLFFLGITWRKLLSQTTVFTIAHASTLFLSTYGIVRLPSWFVEPAIALSIAVIAAENLFKSQAGIVRLAIVFCFGLIHGFGFASSLSDVPFPKTDFAIALLGFNFGVDFGQLFVITMAFLAVGWFRNEPWFRRRIAIPCSVAIAAVGLIWAVQRIAYYATT